MKEVLSKIKPDTKERKRFDLVTKSFLKRLNAKLKDAKAILGGSGAKDTWLSGSHDVDIFTTFDYKKFVKRSSELSNILEKSLKTAFPKNKVIRLHGSRDYFQIRYDNQDFEVVPILKIGAASKAVNITDISPLHSAWVNKNVKNKDEVRLLKQFCRANKIYGAESHIMGFSGYVLEILVGIYGSFLGVLKASNKWGNKEVIDSSKWYKKGMALFDINKSKLNSPVIVVDPVDKTRNAAAALGVEKYALFRKLAKEYLKKPNARYFEKEEISLDKLRKLKGNVVFIEVEPLKGKGDVVGAKLLKVFNHLSRGMEAFDVKKSGWEYDGKTFFYFVSGKKELPKFMVRQGPPVNFKEPAKRFRQKNKRAYVDKGRLFAKVKVNNPKLKDFVDTLLKDEYVKERIKKVVKVEFS